MSKTFQSTTNKTGISKTVSFILLVISAFGVFIVGFDQGQLFSLVEGQKAFDNLYLHELYHDMRHAAGYPCH